MIEFCSYICEVVALTIFLRKKTDKLNKSHFRLFIIIVKQVKREMHHLSCYTLK